MSKGHNKCGARDVHQFFWHRLLQNSGTFGIVKLHQYLDKIVVHLSAVIFMLNVESDIAKIENKLTWSDFERLVTMSLANFCAMLILLLFLSGSVLQWSPSQITIVFY